MTTQTEPTDRHIRVAIPRDLYRRLHHMAVDRDARVGDLLLEAAERLVLDPPASRPDDK